MIEQRAKKIKMVVLDVDGVLTDGKIIYSGFGIEVKNFDVKDGFGIRLLHRAGIKTAVITAKKSRALLKRIKELQINRLYQNAFDKLKAYNDILKRFGLMNEDICYIGDDLLDLPLLKRVGLAVSVKDAVNEVKEIAHYVTEKKGGKGAVREVIDIILKAQGKWEKVTVRYRK
ncbi:MAG: HAD-IIIA family hydrolase [Candidatus Omnitrophota bacterium]|nr:HAD-IIIA family hydrolase [Candidatus Omnitrophota bacterium]